MASKSTTVHVKNIAESTGEKEIREFFSFCGKITDLQLSPSDDGNTKSAVVTFEKEAAAKTALLLNGTQLGTLQIQVSDATGNSEASATPGGSTAGADDAAGHPRERDTDELTQEEKPRSRIFAEYLASGYVIGDAALEQAIEMDHRHNMTNRFLATLHSFDSKYHASDRARAADHSYSISQRAGSLLSGLSSFFEKATHTPTGRRIVDFYTKSSRQVQDIHAEARRLADLKKQEHGGSAYKAAGLEKVFGPGNAGGSTSAESTSAQPTSMTAAPSGAPTGGPTEAPTKA